MGIRFDATGPLHVLAMGGGKGKEREREGEGGRPERGPQTRAMGRRVI